MTEFKKMMIILNVVLVILSVVFVFGSCAAPVKQQRMPAAVLAVPTVVVPGGAIDYIGANYAPSEKITVTFLFTVDPEKTVPADNAVAENAKGLAVNKLGSFAITTTAPTNEGVYALRVYDEKGEMIAASVFRVKAPEQKK